MIWVDVCVGEGDGAVVFVATVRGIIVLVWDRGEVVGRLRLINWTTTRSTAPRSMHAPASENPKRMERRVGSLSVPAVLLGGIGGKASGMGTAGSGVSRRKLGFQLA